MIFLDKVSAITAILEFDLAVSDFVPLDPHISEPSRWSPDWTHSRGNVCCKQTHDFDREYPENKLQC